MPAESGAINGGIIGPPVRATRGSGADCVTGVSTAGRSVRGAPSGVRHPDEDHVCHDPDRDPASAAFVAARFVFLRKRAFATRQNLALIQPCLHTDKRHKWCALQ